ncbi:MAG: glycosyltransferase [Gemmatimonadetes bacterium]|nr:glycosyltransferase [Gemmatimonadota bacterium]
MARILCVTSAWSGILYSTLELARRLRSAGHEVAYASYPEAAGTIIAHGFEHVPLEADRTPQFFERDRDRGWLGRLVHLEERRAEGVEALGVGAFRDRVEDFGADLLLIDGELHGHVIASASLPVRRAVLNPFCSIWRVPGLPPPHWPTRPSVGWAGSRLGIWLSWTMLRIAKRRRAVWQWLARGRCDRLSLLRRLARIEGVDLRRETDYGQWLKPFTWSRLPALSLRALELEFPHTPPAHVRYVGPMVSTTRPDDRVEAGDRSALDDIVAWRGAESERRLVYAGFGSVFTVRPELVQRLIQSVADRPEWRLVLSRAGRSDVATGPLPENVSAFDWVPQPWLLQHTDVAVTHGGATTVDECVLSGVPMLVYCGHATDMAGTTARVVYHGLGIAGDDDDAPTAIAAHLERLLDDRSFARAIDDMRRAYLRYERDRIAERAVEALLS